MTELNNTGGIPQETGFIPRPVPGWSELADSSTAVRVRSVIEEIAEALVDIPPEWVISERYLALYGSQASMTLGMLGCGYPGLALFYAHLVRCGFGSRYADVASRYLEKSFGILEESSLGFPLNTGLTGIAWVTTNIQHAGLDLVDDSVLQTFDEFIAGFVAEAIGSDSAVFELLDGVVGLGVYLLERPLTESSIQLLQGIVDWLAATAERKPGGVAWHTDTRFIPQHEGFQLPDGYYNLGMAHGIPGVVSFLSSVYKAGISRQTCRDLVRDGGRWVLAQRIPYKFDHAIPGWLEPNETYDPMGRGIKLTMRTGWCYGHMGVAVGLLRAANNIEDEELAAEAYLVGLSAARRGPTDGMIEESGICHGATGRALILNRMYHLTGDREFQGQALLSIEKALEWRRPGLGVVGYTTVQPLTEEISEEWNKPEAGLLNGAAGIGLGLLACLGVGEPIWDRFMALSSRPLSPEEQELVRVVEAGS